MKISIVSIFCVVALCWADWPLIWDSGWGDDNFEALHCDLAGNIIAGGWHWQQNGPYTQGYWDICKYDPNGSLLWHNTFYMSGGCILKDLDVDLVGNILVGGYGGTYPGSNYPTWWLIAKYDPGGNLLWDSIYGCYDSGLDGIFGVASGMWGNYHVAVGFVWSLLYPYTPRVLKIDGNGTVIWDRLVDVRSGGIFCDVDIFQTSGDILVAGVLPTRGGGGLIKFDAYGTEKFTLIYPGYLPDSSNCIAVAANRMESGFFALYDAWGDQDKVDLVYYDSAGNLIWERTIKQGLLLAGIMEIGVDLHNNLWIPIDSYILKYDTLGNRLDSINVPMTDAIACRPDTFGNIFIGGVINEPTDWIIDRIEPSGIKESKNIKEPSGISLVLSKNPAQRNLGNLSCSFALAKGDNISLSLYNLAGQHLATLTHGYRKQGIHSVSMKIDNLSAGVYLVVLRTQSGVLTRKLVVF